MRIIRLRRPKPVVEEAPLDRQLQEIADLLLAAKGAFLKTGQRLLARKELATLDPQHYQFSTDLLHLGMTPGVAWDWIAAYRAAHFYSLTEEEAVHLGVSQLKKLQGWLSNRLRDTTNDRTVLRVAYGATARN